MEKSHEHNHKYNSESAIIMYLQHYEFILATDMSMKHYKRYELIYQQKAQNTIFG
jgi:hypothetical protein